MLGGPGVLYGGALGDALADDMARHAGFITQADLRGYRNHDMAVLRALYRGFEITGPPPPCAGPLHIGQMLQILEGFDIAADGFGSLANVHRLAEVLKIAFADRAASTADPDFVPVPVARLLSADYAAQRRAAARSTPAARRPGRPAWSRTKAPTPPTSPWPMPTAVSSVPRGGRAARRRGFAAAGQAPGWAGLHNSLDTRVLPLFAGRVLPFDPGCSPAWAELMAKARTAGLASASANDLDSPAQNLWPAWVGAIAPT